LNVVLNGVLMSQKDSQVNY